MGTQPPIHKWRIPSLKAEHTRAPRSTNRHPHPPFIAPPPPPPAQENYPTDLSPSPAERRKRSLWHPSPPPHTHTHTHTFPGLPPPPPLSLPLSICTPLASWGGPFYCFSARVPRSLIVHRVLHCLLLSWTQTKKGEQSHEIFTNAVEFLGNFMEKVRFSAASEPTAAMMVTHLLSFMARRGTDSAVESLKQVPGHGDCRGRGWGCGGRGGQRVHLGVTLPPPIPSTWHLVPLHLRRHNIRTGRAVSIPFLWTFATDRPLNGRPMPCQLPSVLLQLPEDTLQPPSVSLLPLPVTGRTLQQVTTLCKNRRSFWTSKFI